MQAKGSHFGYFLNYLCFPSYCILDMNVVPFPESLLLFAPGKSLCDFMCFSLWLGPIAFEAGRQASSVCLFIVYQGRLTGSGRIYYFYRTQ